MRSAGRLGREGNDAVTLTIEVPDDLAARLADLPADRLDALRADVNRYAVAQVTQAVAIAGEPAQIVTWEELTGYTDEEEADFAARLGDHGPALAQAFAPNGTKGE